MSEPPIIEVRGLTKTYQVGEVAVHALRGVDLEVLKGEFVAIIGASGSGKSTLFHILGGLTPMTSGTVQINGRDLAGMTNSERTELRKTTVGFVFQLVAYAVGRGQYPDCAIYWRPGGYVLPVVSGDSQVTWNH